MVVAFQDQAVAVLVHGHKSTLDSFSSHPRQLGIVQRSIAANQEEVEGAAW